VTLLRDEAVRWASGEDGGEAGDELGKKRVVVGEFGEGEGAVPGADVGVGDAAAEGRGGEFVGEVLADLLRGCALGPDGEVAGGGRDGGFVVGLAGSEWGVGCLLYTSRCV